MKATIKIIGFDIATHLKEGELAHSIAGTYKYMSPYILNCSISPSKEKNIAYDEKEDIWSLGTICYELLVGNNPFNSDIMHELLSKMNNGEYYIPVTLSKEAISFINCMLKFESQKRLNVDELYNHEFLRKNVKDFNKLDLDIIKKYDQNSKIKISTKNDKLIQEILSKPIFNEKNKGN